MNKNTNHEKELCDIGSLIESIYNNSKDYSTEIFTGLDKIVDKYCDPIDQYGIMYLSDCVLYMNIKWAKEFQEKVISYAHLNGIVSHVVV